MVDTKDLKSFEGKTSCRFESDLGHQIKTPVNLGFLFEIEGLEPRKGSGKLGFPFEENNKNRGFL